MKPFAVLAECVRGEVVESTHLGDLVVTDSSGAVLFAAGDPERLVYYRSAAKPLQALAVVHSGAADRFGFTDTELAICCASHSGSRAHVLTVQGILGKLGLDETALACGIHDPGDPEERNRLIRAGEKASPLHNNCSGKHAGMLATACALGAPVAGYLDREHPVQQAIHRDLSRATGVPETEFHWGVDGCGAWTVAVPLRAIATSFARLGNPMHMTPNFARAANRLRAATAVAPEMVSSPGAFNSELLSVAAGHLVAKGGAEGLFGVGVADPRGLGLAVKVADGSGRPHGPLVVRALEKLGALSTTQVEALDRFVNMRTVNCHGTLAGSVRPVVEVRI